MADRPAPDTLAPPAAPADRAAEVARARAERIVPVAPPPGLRARLLDRIRQEPRFHFARADEGGWSALVGAAGASARLLFQGARVGERTRLVRLAAGDAGPALAGARDPALLVVDGELWRGDERCAPGDFAQTLAPDDAPAWRAATPATVLVVERANPLGVALGVVLGTSLGTSRRRAVVRAADGWRAVAPGVRVRPLAGGAGESVDLSLLEMDPGALLPEHEHAGLEEIFFLRGSCRAQGRRVAAGDYHRAPPGSEHDDTATDEGCLMLVVLRKAA